MIRNCNLPEALCLAQLPLFVLSAFPLRFFGGDSVEFKLRTLAIKISWIKAGGNSRRTKLRILEILVFTTSNYWISQSKIGKTCISCSHDMPIFLVAVGLPQIHGGSEKAGYDVLTCWPSLNIHGEDRDEASKSTLLHQKNIEASHDNWWVFWMHCFQYLSTIHLPFAVPCDKEPPLGGSLSTGGIQVCQGLARWYLVACSSMFRHSSQQESKWNLTLWYDIYIYRYEPGMLWSQVLCLLHCTCHQ